MLKGLLSFYSWRYPIAIIYMLQSSEYKVKEYLAWYLRTKNFNKVASRRSLEFTKPAKLLMASMVFGMMLQIAGAFYLVFSHLMGGLFFGIILLIAYPMLWALLVTLPLLLGRWLIILPKQHRLVKKSAQIFANHKGVKIAVAGSYGKTSMKDLLQTVLSEGKNVSATPGNKNVAISHAYFAKRLTGEEDVVIVEFGEGKPGDVKSFTQTVKPNMAVITGLAPAHIDKYKTLEAAAEDIFSLAKSLPADAVFVNGESTFAKDYVVDGNKVYSIIGVGDWRIKDVQNDIDGLRFTAFKAGSEYNFSSGLLGQHNVGPLIAVIAIADKLGLTIEQIQTGVAKTKPFEHRLQPYKLAGAWVIDDTYNGNIEGMRAGLALLKELPAKRKIYVTPGLVDQGDLVKSVHQELGGLIGNAQPDVVVLMKNSITDYIQDGLKAGGYSGKVLINDNPLEFYTNLGSFVAAGDLVLMQNDWTDNYN
jgi:UDP-N-acetylmuramoyl-tripeptide--D-alanyl-D-alanine ligase